MIIYWHRSINEKAVRKMLTSDMIRQAGKFFKENFLLDTKRCLVHCAHTSPAGPLNYFDSGLMCKIQQLNKNLDNFTAKSIILLMCKTI
jgi:hypothetical protein